MSDPDRLRAIQEQVQSGQCFTGLLSDMRYLLSLVSELTQEREKALAAQCDHETCIADAAAEFDLTLEQALTRAEQAEAERDALARTLEQIRQNVSDDIWELITAKGGGVTG